jgi:hypothetical protein
MRLVFALVVLALIAGASAHLTCHTEEKRFQQGTVESFWGREFFLTKKTP